jgi:acyl-CoA thioester hydrolase
MNKPTPDTRRHYPHYLPITTRWMDNDAYGHVNNLVFYSYFDTVVSQYLIVSGVLDIAASSVIGLVVETQCRYFSPLSFPDLVHAGLRVAQLGRSSVRYEIGLFRNDEQQAAAQGYFVHVYCDRQSRRPVDLPAPLRAALERIHVADRNP